MLYQIIEKPEMLNQDCHFNNNILKNFCTGVGNFLLANYLNIQIRLNSKIKK